MPIIINGVKYKPIDEAGVKRKPDKDIIKYLESKNIDSSDIVMVLKDLDKLFKKKDFTKFLDVDISIQTIKDVKHLLKKSDLLRHLYGR